VIPVGCKGNTVRSSSAGSKPAAGTIARALVALIAPLTLLMCAGRASAAVIPGPGWSIGSVAEPTNFSSSETRDAVEAFAVRATGGTYTLSAQGGEAHGGENPAELSAPIAWDESAEGLQAKLEAVPDIGAGDVMVTGGPGDETGTKPYVVTFVGLLSGQREAVEPKQLSGLSGGEQRVKPEEAQDVSAEVYDRYTVTATNVGSRESKGPVTITDELPAGLVAVSARVEERPSQHTEECTIVVAITCKYNGAVPPGAELFMTVYVATTASSLTGSLVNDVTVSGSGQEASTSESNRVNAGPAPFGLSQLVFEANGLDGGPDEEAGDRPYGVTTTIDLNTMFTGGTGNGGGQFYDVPQEVKNIAVELPLGFVGDPLATERCPEVDMTDSEPPTESGRTACPASAIVGTVRLKTEGTTATRSLPVYNVLPERGYPAELGFNYSGFGQPIFLYASVMPSATGYRLRVATPGAIRARYTDLESIALTVFGDPSEHDGGNDSAAFVTNPTACSSGPLSVSAEVSSWEGGFASAESTAYPAVSGCNLLQGAAAFDPSIEVQPEATQADTPSGYEVELKLPQAA
jgi:hypothetical protein